MITFFSEFLANGKCRHFSSIMPLTRIPLAIMPLANLLIEKILQNFSSSLVGQYSVNHSDSCHFFTKTVKSSWLLLNEHNLFNCPCKSWVIRGEISPLLSCEILSECKHRFRLHYDDIFCSQHSLVRANFCFSVIRSDTGWHFVSQPSLSLNIIEWLHFLALDADDL